MCCGPTDICLSNGLCYVANINRLHRGSCTDPSWNAPECSEVCKSVEDAPGGWADVVSCSADTAPNMFYCGFGNEGRCNPGSTQDVFSLPDGFFADQRNLTLAATGRASSSAVASPTTISPTSTAACPTVAAVQNSVNNSANTVKSCPSRSKTEAGIGLGVGLPLALGLGVALSLLFRERRRGREKLNEQQRAFVEHQLAIDQRRYLQNVHGLHEADSKPHKTIHEAPTWETKQDY